MSTPITYYTVNESRAGEFLVPHSTEVNVAARPIYGYGVEPVVAGNPSAAMPGLVGVATSVAVGLATDNAVTGALAGWAATNVANGNIDGQTVSNAVAAMAPSPNAPTVAAGSIDGLGYAGMNGFGFGGAGMATGGGFDGSGTGNPAPGGAGG